MEKVGGYSTSHIKVGNDTPTVMEKGGYTKVVGYGTPVLERIGY